jgi:UDP-N-acetyl-D-glucosamine dehydrogenase
MPIYTASRVADLLNENELPVFGTKVVAIGVAYKPNIADDRESAAYDVVRELTRRGADVSIYDPIVGSERIESQGFKATDEISGNAIAVVLTDHASFDFEKLASLVPIVFDARGVYRRLRISADNVVAL